MYAWRRHNTERVGKTNHTGQYHWSGDPAGQPHRLGRHEAAHLEVQPLPGVGGDAHEEALGAQLLKHKVLSQHLCDMKKAGSKAVVADITGKDSPIARSALWRGARIQLGATTTARRKQPTAVRPLRTQRPNPGETTSVRVEPESQLSMTFGDDSPGRKRARMSVPPSVQAEAGAEPCDVISTAL